MKIGVLAEREENETRIALVPADAANLIRKGFEVWVEKDAGSHCQLFDSEYEKVGVKIAATPMDLVNSVEWVIKIHPPARYGDLDETSLLESRHTVISLLKVFQEKDQVEQLMAKGGRGYAMDMMPRTTLAQKMDVISSMSNISGYKAVLLAADHLDKLMPMLMTAAGTMKPARVMVIGAGVAGLQAIATAKRLGAVVEAYDTRPAAKEQIISLGAKFIEIPLSEAEKAESETAGGYARKLDDAFYENQRQELTRKLTKMDVVITTAQIFGQKAPILITAEMLRSMPAGGVVVDLAIETGGNCEVTQPGKITKFEDITIIGIDNLPAMVPVHASQMFSRNVYEFLVHLKEKQDEEDADDIEAGTRIFDSGKIVHPMVKSRYEGDRT